MFTDTFLTPVQQITQHCVHWHLSNSSATDHMSDFVHQHLSFTCTKITHPFCFFVHQHFSFTCHESYICTPDDASLFIPPTAFALVKCIMYLACKVAFRYKVSSVAHVTWTVIAFAVDQCKVSIMQTHKLYLNLYSIWEKSPLSCFFCNIQGSVYAISLYIGLWSAHWKWKLAFIYEQ